MPYTARRPPRRRGASNRGARRRPAQPALPFPGDGRPDRPPVRRGDESSRQRRHFTRLLFSLLTAILIANALIGDRGLPATLRIRSQYRELAAAIAELRAVNERLQHEAERLRSDPAALDALARRELGLVRPGERLFIVTDRRAPIVVEDERARRRMASNEPPAGDLPIAN